MRILRNHHMVINILNSGVNSSGGGARKRWHRIAKATLQGKRSDRTRWSIGPRVTHPARACHSDGCGWECANHTNLTFLNPMLGFYDVAKATFTCLVSNTTVLGQTAPSLCTWMSVILSTILRFGNLAS